METRKKPPEGRIVTRLHRLRERNSALVAKKKRIAISKGKLTCEVCDFDFKTAYGDLGDGFIECHHKMPLSTLEPGQTNKTGRFSIGVRQLSSDATPGPMLDFYRGTSATPNAIG